MTVDNTNFFHSKALRNLPKFGLLVRKHTIWQSWSWPFSIIQKTYFPLCFGKTLMICLREKNYTVCWKQAEAGLQKHAKKIYSSNWIDCVGRHEQQKDVLPGDQMSLWKNHPLMWPNPFFVKSNMYRFKRCSKFRLLGILKKNCNCPIRKISTNLVTLMGWDLSRRCLNAFRSFDIINCLNSEAQCKLRLAQTNITYRTPFYYFKSHFLIYSSLCHLLT
jgi:hypothetical protein